MHRCALGSAAVVRCASRKRAASGRGRKKRSIVTFILIGRGISRRRALAVPEAPLNPMNCPWMVASLSAID